jgi:glycosyltransferase involved in cell wall biosynthesis
MKISIVIPACNEEKAIEMTLTGIESVMRPLGIQYEIVVIDDGSTDRTAEIAAAKGVKLIRHSVNKGYGASLKSGIRAASYEHILMIDADGTYPFDQIPLLIKEAENYDMVVGARTGRDVKISSVRRPAKFILNRLADYLAETKIPDLNSGLRIFKKDVVLRFFYILPSGFSFTTTITLALLVNDYSVSFVPINYYKRIGKSKIRPVKDTFNFMLLIIRTVLYFNPLKIFIPVSLTLFMAGIFVFLYSYYFLDRIMDVATILLLVTSIQVAAIGLLADLIDKRLQR